MENKFSGPKKLAAEYGDEKFEERQLFRICIDSTETDFTPKKLLQLTTAAIGYPRGFKPH